MLLLSQLAIAQKPKADSIDLIKLEKKAISEIRSFKYQNARQTLDSVFSISNKTNNLYGKALAAGAYGYMHTFRSNHDSAIQFYNEAVNLLKKINDLNGLAKYTNYKGLALEQMGNFTKALELQFEAMEYAQKAKNKPAQIQIMMNTGTIYAKMYNSEKSAITFQKGLQLSKKLGDSIKMAQFYNNLGNLFTMAKLFDTALNYYDSAYQIVSIKGNIYLMANLLNNKGKILMSKARFKEALITFEKSLTLKRQTGVKQSIAITLNNLAAVYDSLGQVHLSEKFAIEALEIGENINAQHIIKDASFTLSNINALKGNFKKSLAYYQQFKTSSDSLLNKENIEKITKLSMKYDYTQKTQIKELEQQKINTEKEAIIQKQRSMQNILILLMLSLIIIVFILISMYRIKASKNKILTEQREEIKTQNEEIVQINESLNNANNQLIESRKQLEKLNQTKDKFFSIVAHDLKNPFSILQSLIELIHGKYDALDESYKKSIIDTIKQSIDSSNELVENLLMWAKSQTKKRSLQPEINHLYPIVERNIKVTKSMVKAKGLQIKNLVSPVQTAYFDENAIDMVLRNLITNAIKYSNDGGEVFIKAQQMSGQVNVSVADNGIGISENDLYKLFKLDDSHRLIGDSAEKGSGLGLILSKEFIEAGGGEITTTSELGKGSTFTFTIPANRNGENSL